jgi:hypothetical protein
VLQGDARIDGKPVQVLQLVNSAYNVIFDGFG